MSSSSQILYERAYSLLKLIDGLHIENDLVSSRRSVDNWRTEMLSLIECVHRTTTHRLDTLTSRLKELKGHRSACLTQDILPNLSKMIFERRKLLSEKELNDTKKMITKIDNDLHVFGQMLTKIGQDKNKLVEQIDVLKSKMNYNVILFTIDDYIRIHLSIDIQRENAQLTCLDRYTTPKRCFRLDSCHTPFVAMSDDNHLLIEDDNHLVVFNEQRRIHEIPWQQGKDRSYTGPIKDLTYSNYLEQFCILSALNFFTLNRQMSKLEKSEQIRPTTGTKKSRMSKTNEIAVRFSKMCLT
jgi:hypothetical protein